MVVTVVVVLVLVLVIVVVDVRVVVVVVVVSTVPAQTSQYSEGMLASPVKHQGVLSPSGARHALPSRPASGKRTEVKPERTEMGEVQGRHARPLTVRLTDPRYSEAAS